jgi:hypothetical protein
MEHLEILVAARKDKYKKIGAGLGGPPIKKPTLNNQNPKPQTLNPKP